MIIVIIGLASIIAKNVHIVLTYLEVIYLTKLEKCRLCGKSSNDRKEHFRKKHPTTYQLQGIHGMIIHIHLVLWKQML